MKRIFISLIVFLFIITILSIMTYGTFYLIETCFLAATTGIYMGLLYPAPVFIKFAFITSLIVSIVAVGFGFRNYTQVRGQILAVVGVVAWFILGILGLSTGT